jgi:hypothetical protein
VHRQYVVIRERLSTLLAGARTPTATRHEVVKYVNDIESWSAFYARAISLLTFESRSEVVGSPVMDFNLGVRVASAVLARKDVPTPDEESVGNIKDMPPALSHLYQDCAHVIHEDFSEIHRAIYDLTDKDALGGRRHIFDSVVEVVAQGGAIT